jgi:hypothetical protein
MGAMPPALSAVVIFQIGSCIYACAGMDHNPSIHAFYVAGMTGMHYHTKLFIG